MRLNARLVPLIAIAAIGLACAGAKTSTAGTDRNTLTRAEIEEAGASLPSAREAVRVLRPQWLIPPRGRVASSDVLGAGGGVQVVVVYIDDIRQPDLESLANVPSTRIIELKYLDQNRAILLRGPGHEAGVIEVTTSTKRK